MQPRSAFFRYDGPTWLVAVVLYSAWAALVWYHAWLPWWVIMPVGAYLLAWHFSLQHEAIHSFRGVPPWVRIAVVFPPLGLWFPFPLYRKSHTTHHRDVNLTVPGVDTESYYVSPVDWQRMGRVQRGLLLFNQTMLGRLLIGPALRLWILVSKESRRVATGDFSHLPHWALHGIAIALLFWFISGVCGFVWWQYCLLVAYPGMSLSLLRAFTEHRAAEDTQQRTAAVESNVVMGMLYLYNNLHVVHHFKPTMPWYEIPRFYRENRRTLLAATASSSIAAMDNLPVTTCWCLYSIPYIRIDSAAGGRGRHPQDAHHRRHLHRQYAGVVRLHCLCLVRRGHRGQFLSTRRRRPAAGQGLSFFLGWVS